MVCYSSIAMDDAQWVQLSLLAQRLRTPLVPGLEALGGPAAFFASSPSERREALPGLTGQGLRAMEAVLAYDPRPELDALRAIGGRIIPYSSPDYPKGIRELPDPPPCLFVLGDPKTWARRCVTIVGSRSSSAYGLDMARRIATDLSVAGVAVVSGLAVGVDAAAHEGALPCVGRTVAILGCGLDDPYPRKNQDVRRRIAERGALVTEYAPGTPPAREQFPRRNRLLAAMSLLTIVVGASATSGALITASVAIELGREVGAVPGSVRDPFNRGAHRLIQEGAQVIDNAETALALLGVDPAADVAQELALDDLSEDERRVFDLLAYTPIHRDALGEASGLGPGALSVALTMLAARGLVDTRPGDCYVRGV